MGSLKLNPATAANGGPPAGAEGLLRDACDELERRLRAGEVVRAEELLIRHPELGNDSEQALDLIYVEYATRRELGESPSREEFFTRFPEWQAALERQFHLDEFLDEDPTLLEGNGPAVSTSLPASGRFRVLRLFARGGIGQVMRAMDLELNREVAVKEIQPALAGNHAVRERFLREAEITARLEHPGIVPVYGLGRDAAGRPFYAMRLVRGQSLQAAIEELHRRADGSVRYLGVEFQKLLRRFLHVCETVAYAHSRGVIHRDLKPANILLGPYGETLVVDWGLARSIGPAGPSAVENESPPPPAEKADSKLPDVGRSPSDASASPQADWTDALTRTAGEVVGTPAFMSPEQARGEAQGVGPASDVYSLGATLYMLLTGQVPFVSCVLEETLIGVIAGSFTRPRKLNRAIPPPLEAVCLQAMARRPEDRYASPRELADDLEHWLADEPVSAAREPFLARLARWGRRNRTRVVAGMIALVLITIVSVVAAFRINGERVRADGERIEANRQRIEADRERSEADRQRVEANRRTARLAFDRGFALTKDHEYGDGMLWFARALEHAPVDDLAIRRVILTNMDATRHYLLHRRSVFANNVNLGHMAFSPDGKRLVTTSIRAFARLWDVESGEMLFERKLQSGSSGSVVALHVFHDGSTLVAIASGLTFTVQRLPADWGVPLEPPVKMRHDERIASAAFSPDGNVLAVGSSTTGSSKTRLWRMSDGERLGDLEHPTAVGQILFRPQTHQVATVGSDGLVRLWEMTDGRPSPVANSPVREFRAVSRRLQTIAFSPDGKRMLAGDSRGTISDWEVDTGRRLPDLANQSGIVTAIAVASDGQTAAAAWDTGMARVWSLTSQAKFCELLRLDRHAGILTLRPGTRQLLIAAEPHAAALWDVPDPARLAPVLSQKQVSAIAFSPDGEQAITGSRDKTVRLRDTKSGRMVEGISNIRHEERVSQVAYRPDGAVILTASSDGTARLWNANGGTKRGQVMDHRASAGARPEVTAALFSPEGQWVLTGDSRGVIQTWNGDTGEPVRTWERISDQAGTVGSLCFSPGGDRAVAGFSLGQVGLWDARSGKLQWTVRHGERVRAVAISPDGQLVLSASNDETARFWNAADGKPVGPVLQHRGQVFVARFSPDGRLAATAGFDTTVRLWEVPSGRLVGEPMRHEGVVAAAAFSRDGTRLLTGGSRDRTARLWDVATCLPLSPPLEHDEDVFSVAIHPAGQVAFTGRFWRLPAPLPDDQPLIDLWVQLATQRTFKAGDNIEWLDPAELAELAREFHAHTGMSWSDWADHPRAR